MDTSGRSVDAPFSAAEAAELLDLVDSNRGFFGRDLGSLLPNEHAIALTVPVSTPDPNDPGFQLESAATRTDTQVEDAGPDNSDSLEATKKMSTFHRQKEELTYLRGKVAELETQLSELKSSGQESRGSADQAHLDQSLRATAASLTMWEVVAKHQLSERHRAEQENVELRKLLKEQVELATSLKRMLRRRLAPLRTIQDQHHIVEVDEQDSNIFKALLRNVEERMCTVDSIFATHGFTPATTNVNSIKVESGNDDQGMRVEFLNATLIAADVRLLSSTIWNILHAKRLAPAGQSVRVVEFTDEVLVLKQVIQFPSGTGLTGSMVMLSVLKRVTQDNRVLLLWERLVERYGATGSEAPVSFLSQFGCGQITRMDDSASGRPPASLVQSYVQIKPITQTKPRRDLGQTPHDTSSSPVNSTCPADLELLIALYQQNRQNFLLLIENELDGVVRDINTAEI